MSRRSKFATPSTRQQKSEVSPTGEVLSFHLMNLNSTVLVESPDWTNVVMTIAECEDKYKIVTIGGGSCPSIFLFSP